MAGLAADSGGSLRDFAAAWRRRICAAQAAELLYEVATDSHPMLSRPLRHRILFRSAYVLERICFEEPAHFAPCIVRFCRSGFHACADSGAQRSFAKIMAHLLATGCPDPQSLEPIAQTAMAWALDPRSKPAVRIWAVEVLKRCRKRVEWVAASWEDLLETLARDATPAVEARMRSGWR